MRRQHTENITTINRKKRERLKHEKKHNIVCIRAIQYLFSYNTLLHSLDRHRHDIDVDIDRPTYLP